MAAMRDHVSQLARMMHCRLRPFIGALDVVAETATTTVVWLFGAVTANLSTALAPFHGLIFQFTFLRRQTSQARLVRFLGIGVVAHRSMILGVILRLVAKSNRLL